MNTKLVHLVWIVGWLSGAAFEVVCFKFGLGWAILVGLVLSFGVGMPLLARATRGGAR